MRIEERAVQLTLFDFLDNPVLEKLRGVDPDRMTPLEAISLVAELAREARKQ